MDRDRDLPGTLPKRLLQPLQHPEIAGEFAQLPLLAQRLLQALEVAARALHVGLFDLDIVQADHRIELDRPDLGTLPDDLLVNLALGRDVDHDVALQPRLAAEPALRPESPPPAIALLDLAERRDMITRRADAVLGELALGDRDLTAPAQAAAAADRIDVDPEHARGLEQRCAERKTTALARRREDDERGFGQPRDYPRRRRRSRRSLPSPSGWGSRNALSHRRQSGS